LPEKALLKINGVPVLVHLIRRLQDTGLPVILAVPYHEHERYADVICGDWGLKEVSFYTGPEADPLERMAQAAEFFGLENVIRVTHDKIFVDPRDVFEMLDYYYLNHLDYIYSSTFIPGTGFEIISSAKLKEAAAKFKEVEFIGYAVRAVTERAHDYNVIQFPEYRHNDFRLLIDYPKDVDLLTLLFARLGNAATLSQAVDYMAKNAWSRSINKLPRLTYYTCVYNGERFIERAMGSVSQQRDFRQNEYIIVDDGSTDATPEMVARFCTLYPNTRWYRNHDNLGLASSSNVAISKARGEYILRLDADDYFVNNESSLTLLSEIAERGLDAMYPDHYIGSTQDVIGSGADKHHVGGSIFSTRAINFLRFTDKLRGYEGLDIFLRAKDKLRIGYSKNGPAFYYTQRPDSLSKQNLAARAEIKRLIEQAVCPV
jgi:spore coat polysaccharide biosynthesis protein SpsF (cytidylyltransferase family)